MTARSFRLLQNDLFGGLLLISGLVMFAVSMLSPWSPIALHKAEFLVICAVAALGVQLCWGMAGFVPLGTAAFIGLGGVVGSAVSRFLGGTVASVPLVILASAASAALVGYFLAALVFRRPSGSGERSNSFFSFFTLVFAGVFMLLPFNSTFISGGGLDVVSAFGKIWHGAFFIFVLLVLVSSCILVNFISKTPLGVLWRAAGDNENRLELSGFVVHEIKALAFAFASALAGVAGALLVFDRGGMDLSLATPLFSLELVLWTAIGGKKRPAGAIAGCLGVGIISILLESFRLPAGGIFAFLVFFVILSNYPGIVGFLGEKRLRNVKKPGTIVLDSPLGSRDHTVKSSSLEASDVVADAGSIRVLDEMSLSLNPGAVHFLLGPVEGGKNAIMETLTGRTRVSSGKIIWRDKKIESWAPWQFFRAGIGRTFRVPQVFPSLTIADNLALVCWSRFFKKRRFYLSPKWRRMQPLHVLDIKKQLPFLEDSSMPAGDLAPDERKLLEFAMVIGGATELVLLDHPTTGLDSKDAATVMAMTMKLCTSVGMIAVVSESNTKLASRVDGPTFVIDRGKVLGAGSFRSIDTDPNLRHLYSGIC